MGGRQERLAQHLASEHLTPSKVNALADEDIMAQRLERKHLYEITKYVLAHR